MAVKCSEEGAPFSISQNVAKWASCGSDYKILIYPVIYPVIFLNGKYYFLTLLIIAITV